MIGLNAGGCENCPNPKTNIETLCDAKEDEMRTMLIDYFSQKKHLQSGR